MNELFNKLSAVALATALVAPAAVAMGKNDSGVQFSSYSGVGLYSHHQISGAFWGGIGVSYWKSSDISLEKLATSENAAKQTGTLKKLSVLPGISYHIGDGFFTSLDLMIGKHTMEITPAHRTVVYTSVDNATTDNRIYGVSYSVVSVTGATSAEHPYVETVSTASGSGDAAQLTAIKALAAAKVSTADHIIVGYGVLTDTPGDAGANTPNAVANPDAQLCLEHKFNTIQPVFGVGYTTAMMDNADEISFTAKLQLAYTGKSKVEYKSGGFKTATVKGEAGAAEAIADDVITPLLEKYTDDFKKNSQKKSYFFGASGFAPAVEVSIGFSF